MQVFPGGSGVSALEAFERLAKELPLAVVRLGAAGGASGRFTLVGVVAATKTVAIEEYAEVGSLRPPAVATACPAVAVAGAAALAEGSQHSDLGCGPGWFVALPYELGEVLEPASRALSALRTEHPALPVVWQRIDTAIVHDAVTDMWSGFGEWEMLLARARSTTAANGEFALSSIDAAANREGFERNVRRALEYIGAGDIYQANITHALRTGFSGCARALAMRLFALAKPAHGCIARFVHEGNDHTLISCSPELFLAGSLSTRNIITRPMKGTRPADADPSELVRSIKDQAELAMIIDLMRNDLGRVCEMGTVRVESARTIERHGEGVRGAGVLQATGTIRGTLREETTLDGLLRATFPGGSITGAPKIRAQQIIGELERVPRGYYCGSMGFVADNGEIELNIAIRTAHVSASSPASSCSADARHCEPGSQHFEFGIGAGIVADSDPEAEWRETLDKAWLLRHLTELTSTELA